MMFKSRKWKPEHTSYFNDQIAFWCLYWNHIKIFKEMTPIRASHSSPCHAFVALAFYIVCAACHKESVHPLIIFSRIPVRSHNSLLFNYAPRSTMALLNSERVSHKPLSMCDERREIGSKSKQWHVSTALFFIVRTGARWKTFISAELIKHLIHKQWHLGVFVDTVAAFRWSIRCSTYFPVCLWCWG